MVWDIENFLEQLSNGKSEIKDTEVSRGNARKRER